MNLDGLVVQGLVGVMLLLLLFAALLTWRER